MPKPCTNSRRLRRAITAALTGLAVGDAMAATKAPPAPGALDEIVITAQKRTESLQRAAASISVLSGEVLAERGAVSFADYITQVPSLAYTGSGPGDQFFSIRGVADRASAERQNQMTTGVYLDDVLVSNNFTSPDLHLFDMDRVEVLRGPQGTLYGDGSIGGVVRLITNKADPSAFHALAQVELSDTRKGGTNYSAKGMINLPLSTDSTALRLVGYYVDNSGFIDNATTARADFNDEETKGGRVSFRHLATEDLSITVNLLAQNMLLGGRGRAQAAPEVGELKHDFPTPTSLEYGYGHANLTIEYRAPFANVMSSTTYSDYERDDLEDASDTIYSLIGLPNPSSVHAGSDVQSYSEELRFTSHADSSVDWVAGAYFFRLENEMFEDIAMEGLQELLPLFGVPPGSPLDLGNDVLYRGLSSRTRTLYSAFGDVTWHLNERWAATIGLRWAHDKLESTTTNAGLAFGSPPFTSALDISDSKATGRVRIAFQASESTLLYAQASQGYRIGGLNALTPATVSNPNFPRTYQDDTLDAYELGLKKTLFDRRVTLNTALFRNDWRDVQVLQISPEGFGFMGNGGEAHTHGVEFELAASLTERLQLSLGGAALEAELDGEVPALGAHEGDPLPGVPELSASGALQYTAPAAGGEMYGRVNATYVDTTHLNFGQSDDAAGNYALADARVGFKRSQFDVSLYVRNVGDRRAALDTIVYQNPALGFYRRYHSTVRPRTIGVSVQYSW